MTRKQKLFLSMGTGLLKQIVVLVCGFILPRYILLFYGSGINGLISSITHFLGFISLLEMGIGPVIQANLYGPLAKKDNEQISKIIISSERFFRRIAYIFLAYIVVLAILFPLWINKEYEAWFSISLIFIIAISTFAQYFFGATYQLLLNADQKAYVQIALQIATTILNTVLCIVLMKIGASIHMVKLISATIFVIRPLGQAVYVRHHYNLDKNLIITEEPIKQKWNGFSQHLASVVCGNIDVVILTFFSTLSNVSIYSVYYSVTNGITNIIMTAATGLESMFGNMMANGEKKTLTKTFEAVELAVHTVVTLVFTITMIMIVPFISIYTRGIDDANYILPLFGYLLVLAYAAQCLRVPYFRLIKAAGHFKETQNGAFISTGLNLVISLILVFKIGLAGIAIGTLVAMLYHTIYFVWYLKSHILNRSMGHFFYYMLTDIVIGGVTFLCSKRITLSELSYFAWIIMALKVVGITIGVAILVNMLLHGRTIINFLKMRKRKD